MRHHVVPVGRYFTAHEFRDQHAGREVSYRARPGLRQLCAEALDPLRREFGLVIVTSGYRTHKTNVMVGGAAMSRHLYDTFPSTPAADVFCRRGTPEDWYRWLDARIDGGLGLYPGHIHVDLRRSRARWQG